MSEKMITLVIIKIKEKTFVICETEETEPRKLKQHEIAQRAIEKANWDSVSKETRKEKK